MKYTLSNEDLLKHLQSQLMFINNSQNSYDNGFEDEAQRIATCLRVLLHDTNNSKSIFKQLKIKNMLFLSTTENFIPANMVSYHGLLSIFSSNEQTKYKPIGLDGKNIKLLNFDNWWNEIIIYDKQNLFSRKDIVLSIANKDGGAHVDPKLNKTYARLTKDNSIRWKFIKNNIEKDIENNPAYTCIRQISDELIFSYSLSLFETLKSESLNKYVQKYEFNTGHIFIAKKIDISEELITNIKSTSSENRTNQEIRKMIKTFEEKVLHGYSQINNYSLKNSEKLELHILTKKVDSIKDLNNINKIKQIAIY